jgi:glutathione peroxidase
MKHTVCAVFLGLLFCLSAAAEDIYDIQLKSIDGSKIDLSLYRGKKMLIIVLPGSQADGAMTIAKLTELAGRYADSLVIIGVPAQEWGYEAGSKDSLKALYKNLPPNFILAEGMKVRKDG